jgi:hypothetical protein
MAGVGRIVERRETALLEAARPYNPRFYPPVSRWRPNSQRCVGQYVGPEHVAHITVVASVDPTDARNAKSRIAFERRWINSIIASL